ncbi:division/cell wall cluster transcriptional repressor MraZ [Actinocrinis puniceicyclus]|uniref:Transcriptional regulator MraZ n=1 Tax=Actinocrinis puniceicyclus TaxID=977794 RepID=A0A8J7WKM1_9ACTN|nr:division/cell wall cluster transcriptional repressor MraZ [Actinocrinis puniceicyclus]MBS2964051.1 division/cell wall cluster transcriptional repressor MraZ [Actinocrinis puniceicyclus]
MFLGTFVPRLDDKGRLILPARFREEAARIDGTERLVITKGQERCLSVWPASAFAEAADRIRRASATGSLASPRAVRDYLRVLYAGASEQSFDKQGRITLPPALREYAGLTQQVAVVGADTHFELWDAAAWDRYVAEKEPAFADLDQDDLFRGVAPDLP